MRAALIQIKIAYGEPQKNIEKISSYVDKCMSSEKKPDVIILPEMWNTSFALPEIELIADQEGYPAAESVRKLACKHRVNIVAGSVADKRKGKIYNTCYVFDRKGQTIARYDKVHLFSLMNEPAYITPGGKRALFKLDGILCGVIICYDVRFPELSRAYAMEGAQILFVPAQFPHPRYNPWMHLVPARAIENQMYVVGVNRIGKENNAEFFGRSMVVEPKGDIVICGTENKEEILIADLDPSKVKESREYMRCLEERREDVYKNNKKKNHP